MKPEINESRFSNVFCKTSGQDVELVYGFIKGSQKKHLNECTGIDKCEIGINNCPHKNTTPVKIITDDGTTSMEIG